ncbi:MAG: ATP-binding protein [Chloroflexota bacterium]|nr:ATP-binding protein [Chloroflexota bacterium]
MEREPRDGTAPLVMPLHPAARRRVGQSNLSGVSSRRDITVLADGYESAKHRSYYLHGCPCGFAGDPARECRCGTAAIARYQQRISGPLLDRIDIYLEASHIDDEQLADRRAGQPGAAVRGELRWRERGRQNTFLARRWPPTPTWGRGSCRSTRRWTGRGTG